MANAHSAWNLTSSQWCRLTDLCQARQDVLEDGAYVRHEPDADELHFFATPFSKPAGWHYPFLETISGVRQTGAFVGRVWHVDETGFVDFEIMLYAAAQTLRADYESGVADLDYVAYEQSVEQAVRGTDDDLAWLQQEFSHLTNLAFIS